MEKSLYRADIDGLRAVGVLGVLFNHLSAPLVPGGYVGVDIFFVISGYLITRIISREMAEGTFTFARFYERRVRRLFPALFAMLAVTLVAGYFLLLPSDYASTLRATLGTLFFSSNMIFWREMARGYFAATDAMLNPLLHTWSLGVEEQFYLFFPVVLLFAYRYLRRHIPIILLLSAGASLIGAAALVDSKSVAVFFLSPFRAWELLIGSLLAIRVVPVGQSRLLRELLSLAGLLAIFFAFFTFDHKTSFPGLSALLPVLGAAAIIYAGEGGGSLIGRLLQLKPAVYIGLISYSLYLWHWPLIVLFRYGNGMAPIDQHFVSLLFASLVLGAVSYHLIEQPVRRGLRISRPAIFAAFAVPASIFIVIGVSGLVQGGFKERFQPEVALLDAARTPEIPYLQCDGRAVTEWCTLGSEEARPTILVWGDSHALAWAPALHETLSRQGLKAVFANNSACPPFFDVSSEANQNCAVRNNEVKEWLSESQTPTVILSAHWSGYFRSEGPISAMRNGIRYGSMEASREAMISTLSWLRASRKTVFLMGPVPVYGQNVPMMKALELARGETLVESSEAEQREKHAAFFQTFEQVTPEPWLTFLDPIEWMCTDTCLTTDGGVPLYRDAHHLSVAGALRFMPQLNDSLQVKLRDHSIARRTLPQASDDTQERGVMNDEFHQPRTSVQEPA